MKDKSVWYMFGLHIIIYIEIIYRFMFGRYINHKSVYMIYDHLLYLDINRYIIYYDMFGIYKLHLSDAFSTRD